MLASPPGTGFPQGGAFIAIQQQFLRAGHGVPVGRCQGQQITMDMWAGPGEEVREGTPLQGVTGT